jgi:hypothetical protein
MDERFTRRRALGADISNVNLFVYAYSESYLNRNGIRLTDSSTEHPQAKEATPIGFKLWRPIKGHVFG